MNIQKTTKPVSPSMIEQSRHQNSDVGMSVSEYFDRINTTLHQMAESFSPFSALRTFPAYFTNLTSRLWDGELEQRVSEDGSLLTFIDVPGVDEKDLSVEIMDNQVRIQASRTDRGSEWKLDRTFSIDSSLYNIDSLQAEINKGVLALTISPVVKSDRTSKKIEVRSTRSSK